MARALRAEASRNVSQDLSLGTAIAACMSLLVAAAVAAGGRGGGGAGRRAGGVGGLFCLGPN